MVLSFILLKLISVWFLLNFMIKYDCWCIENIVYNVLIVIVYLVVMFNEKLKYDIVCYFFCLYVYNLLMNYIDLCDILVVYRI